MTACPGVDELRRLLHEELADGAQQAIETHLESCATCQRALERMAAAAPSWDQAARHLASADAPTEAALAKAVDELENSGNGPRTPADDQTQGEARPDAAREFTYLERSATPGHLGRLDHYEIIEVIGRGGMGVVFKALDQRLQRIVAVKVLGPQYAASVTARKRFEREARAAAAVSHDHVVPIHDIREIGGIIYLVMPMVPGKSLQERIDQGGALELKETLRIGAQIASGLAAAHKQGLVHRDIKPANILLENGVERVKITDFGLARAVDDASVTQSGVITGTPMFMSPEQARGEYSVDARSDLFSLGSVLYVMATGRLPFRAAGTHAVLNRVITDTPRPLREVNPDLPDWLEAIVAKLHAKRPEDRFASAAEVADLLGQHLAHLQEPRRVAMPAPVAPPADAAPARTEKLFEGTGRCKRIVQQIGLLSGLGFVALGALSLLVSLANRAADGVCFGVFVMLVGAMVWWITSRIRQRFEVRYRGHAVRVENHCFRGEALFIDGVLVARGGLGMRTQLRGLIRDGAGVGDEIIVLCEPGLFRFGCRISVEPQAVRVAPAEYAPQHAGRAWGVVAVVVACLFVAGGCGVIGVLFGGAIVGMLGAIALARPEVRPPVVIEGPKGEPDKNAWASLFNGKDFSGWIAPPPDSKNWQIDDNGNLVGRGNPAPTNLFTERDDFENFHLRGEVKVSPGSEGSVFFRSAREREPGMPVLGYRVIIGQGPLLKPGTLMSMAANDANRVIQPMQLQPLKDLVQASTWFGLETVADGAHLIVKIGGNVVVDRVDEEKTHQRGRIALQIDSPQGLIQFRKLEIRELPGKVAK